MKINDNRIGPVAEIEICLLFSRLLENRFKVNYLDHKDLLVIKAKNQESMNLLFRCVKVKSTLWNKNVIQVLGKEGNLVLLIKGGSINHLANSLYDYFEKVGYRV